MSNEKSMKEILLAELNKEIKAGSIKKSDAVLAVDIFDEEMEEGHSDGEALDRALDEVNFIKAMGK